MIASVFDILDEIGNTRSKNDKVELVEEYSDHEMFLKVMQMGLDPRRPYFMDLKTFPEPKHQPLREDIPTNLVDALRSLDRMTSRELSGQNQIDFVAGTLANLSDDEREVYTRVILKNMKIGAAASTFNKGVEAKDQIYIHPYQGCQPYNEKNMKRIEYPAIIQIKEDGCYNDVIITKRPNIMVSGTETRAWNVEAMSRSGQPFIDRYNEALLDAISKLATTCDDSAMFPDGMVVQGELMMYEPDMVTVMPRKKSNGILNSTITPQELERVFMVIWDIVDLPEWKSGKGTKPFNLRHADVVMAYRSQNFDSGKYLKLCKTQVVECEEEAYAFFDDALNAGLEGAIIKNFKALWRDGKSTDQVKMKDVRECDLEIVAAYEGEGQFEGALGGFTCRTSCGLLEVNIGGGFTPAQRVEMWANRDLYIGKIVAVKYNEIIDSDTKPGMKSLFLPRKKASDGTEIRHDKTVANTLAECIAEKKANA